MVMAASEHADHSGWSCVLCNGPCRQPNSELPRCGEPAPGLVGALCQLHEGHTCTHGFGIRWGEGWDKR